MNYFSVSRFSSVVFPDLRIHGLFFFFYTAFQQSTGFYGLHPFFYLLQKSDADIIFYCVHRHSAKDFSIPIGHKSSLCHFCFFCFQRKKIAIQKFIEENFFQRKIVIHIFQEVFFCQFCRPMLGSIGTIYCEKIILGE